MTENHLDHMLEEAAKEMMASIDFEVLTTLLVETGWTKLTISYGPGCKWVNVKDWVESSCQGQYQEHSGVWIFENPKDATAFAMRWS